MQKIFINRILQLCCILVTLLFVACENDNVNGPVIKGVRNYAPSPDDSVLQSLEPGQWVVLTGSNLRHVTQVIISGVPVTVNSSLFSDNNAVVQVPAVIPFPIIPAEQLNTIQYFTQEGSTTFSFEIAVPAPTITAISNENANAGDLVTISGTNLFLLTKFSYAGVEITEYTSSNDGTYVSFILPEITGSGPVVVENKAGGYTTLFNINDPTGMLCNFDDVNTLSWGPTTDNSGATFTGNKGTYAILKNDGLSAGNFTWWDGNRSINTNAVQWLSKTAIATDTLRGLEDYAFKFEINIPQKWNGTSLFIAKDGDWTYIARFEPWLMSNGKTTPVTTSGKWSTVTIPLSNFLTKANGKDGTGVPAANLKALLGASGKGSVNMYTINDSGEAAAPLNIGIDNMRVVKIK